LVIKLNKYNLKSQTLILHKMIDNNPFKKIQISVALSKPAVVNSKINILSLEIGYPDSYGDYVWKSSGRIYDKITQTFLKAKSKSGDIIDAVMPCTWNDFENDTKDFVFDFVKNATASNIKMRLQILYENKYAPEIKEFEFLESDTKVTVPYLEIKISEKIIGTD
jgi:hypothetical protein